MILTLLLTDSASLLALAMASLNSLLSLCSDWRLGLEKGGVVEGEKGGVVEEEREGVWVEDRC